VKHGKYIYREYHKKAGCEKYTHAIVNVYYAKLAKVVIKGNSERYHFSKHRMRECMGNSYQIG